MSNKSKCISISILLIVAMVFLCTGCSLKKVKTENSNYPYIIENANTDFSSVLDLNNMDKNQYPNEELSADDLVWVIIDVKGNSLYDSFISQNTYETFSDYISSIDGVNEFNNINTKINTIEEELINNNLAKEIKYSYTTLKAGLSAQIKYGDINKLYSINGIKNVVICENYVLENADINAINTYIVNNNNGITDNNTEYQGQGMLVAVIDTGALLNHSTFQTAIENPVLDKADVAALLPSMLAGSKSASIDKIYVSSKIPFNFNYKNKTPNANDDNGHGTHVAGILTGNDDTITGVAPLAQLAAMKVAGADGSANTSDIVAAINDCAILGVDVVNISMGAPNGFYEERSSSTKYFNDIYALAEKLGITLIVAAGNENNKLDLLQNSSNGQNVIDYGTVGSPASFPTNITVASADSTLHYFFNVNDNVIFYYNGVDSNKNSISFEEQILNNNDSFKAEIVAIPNSGSDIDYQNIDVTGKIALVKRGEITFGDKIINAQNHGAIACIIYNNEADTNIQAQLDKEVAIPFCTISMTHGEAIKAISEKENAVFYINKGNFYYSISSFSSWGGGNRLDLNVDLLSFGGQIYSSFALEGYPYVYLSGTSMASPNAAGIMTIVKQYLKSIHPELSTVALQNLAIKLLMSSATITKNAYAVPYSPRQQGAGMASIENAINTKALLSVNGSNKVKLSLGHDINKDGIYTLRFNLENFSNESLSYNINSYVLTDDNVDGTLTQNPYLLNPSVSFSAVNGIIENGTITIEGNTTAEITAVIVLSEADIEYLNKFPYGAYVDGFIEFASDSEQSLSIPFLSFYGDYTAAPLFDKTIYDEEDAFISGISLIGNFIPLTDTLDANVDLGSYSGWVMNPGTTAPSPKEEYISISQQALACNKLYSLNLILLRNVKRLDLIIKDEYNSVIYKNDYSYNVPSVFPYSGMAKIVSFPIDMSTIDYAFSNNQKLYCEIIGELDYEGENKIQTLTLPIYIDSEKPTLLNSELTRNEENRVILNLDVYDNNYLQNFILAYSMDHGKNVTIANVAPIPVYKFNKGTTNSYSLDITNYLSKLKGELCLYVMDYAYNYSLYTIGDLSEYIITDENEVNNIDSIINSNSNETIKYDYYYVTNYDNEPSTDNEFIMQAVSENPEDWFVVSNGTLTAYKGPGGDVVIPDNLGIKIIGKNVFKDNLAIKSVYIPASVTMINEAAFRKCKNLETVTFEKESQLTTINFGAFFQCKSLKSINLEDTSLQELKSIVFFYCCSLTEITLPKGDLKMDTDVFMGNNALKKFTSYANITAVNGGIGILENCEEIYLYGDLVDIRGYLFMAIPKCKTLEIRGNIIKMGTNSFSSKSKDIMFGDAPLLKGTLHFYGDVININAAAFSNLGVSEIMFHGKVENISQSAFGGNELVKRFSVSDDNQYMTVDAETGIMYNADKTKMFTPSNWDYSGEITIPDSVTGGNFLGAASYLFKLGYMSYTEEYIGYGFSYNTYYNVEKPLLKKITLGKGLTSLPDSAFKGFTNLEEIVGLENIEEIGGYHTYLNCQKLKQVYMPESTTILDATFMNCYTITTINIPDSVESMLNTFSGCQNLKTVTGMANVCGLYNTFSNCISLESIILPEGMADIGYAAFKNCIALTNATIEGSIYEIYLEAFYNCKSLKSIDFPDCYYIEPYAFYGCKNLESLELSVDELEIYDYAFYGCEKLTEFDFSNRSISYIGAYAFAYTNLSEIVLSSEIYNIDKIFYECNNVSSVTVCEDDGNYNSVDGVVYSEDDTILVWYPAKKDTKAFTIPDSVSIIWDKAFSSTVNLETVNLNKVKAIGTKAFAHSAITSIELKGIESIGSFAFAYCNNLRNVSISKDTCDFDLPFIFADSPVEISFENGNNNFVFENGFIYNKDKTIILKATTENKELIIPEGVVKIAAYAFVDCTSIEKLVLPSTLKTIGANAFFGCTNLGEIEFKSEKAPQLEGVIEEGHTQLYANFKCHIEDVNGDYIKVICPDDASYRTYIWNLYFGL